MTQKQNDGMYIWAYIIIYIIIIALKLKVIWRLKIVKYIPMDERLQQNKLLNRVLDPATGWMYTTYIGNRFMECRITQFKLE